MAAIVTPHQTGSTGGSNLKLPGAPFLILLVVLAVAVTATWAFHSWVSVNPSPDPLLTVNSPSGRDAVELELRRHTLQIAKTDQKLDSLITLSTAILGSILGIGGTLLWAAWRAKSELDKLGVSVEHLARTTTGLQADYRVIESSARDRHNEVTTSLGRINHLVDWLYARLNEKRPE